MNMPLLEIQPRTLKFLVELKKQSSCAVQLTNTTDHFVAFKVKTTSPKKYCVRPNVGIVKPNASCEFTVIMQALKEAPPDMVCKDKFLIQSTIVPEGTVDEDITASMYAKGEGKRVEENKLRVSLVLSPPHSPVLSPLNGTLKQGPIHEDSLLKDRVFNRPESLVPPQIESVNIKQPMIVSHEELKPIKDADHDKYIKPAKRAEWQKSNFVKLAEDSSPENDTPRAMDLTGCDELKFKKETEIEPFMKRKDAGDEEIKMEQPVVFTEHASINGIKATERTLDADALKAVNDIGFMPSKKVEFDSFKAVEDLKLVKDIEEMKSKVNALESKLKEADSTISNLIEERSLSFQQRQSLQQELAELRTKKVIKQVNVGFPLLFVCVVAFVSIILGYRLHT